MPLSTENVPLEGEILCEHCGYGLTGLPVEGRCPECGEAVADSTTADRRVLPAWESPETGGRWWGRFVRTTVAVLTGPGDFFRRLVTRAPTDRSRVFAFMHQWISGYLLALAASVHLLTVVGPRVGWDVTSVAFFGLLGATAGAPVVFLLIAGTFKLTAALTVFEAKYHGFRLPRSAVVRAMHYHSATLLPVAVATLGITAGYRLILLTKAVPRSKAEFPYLSVLSVWVVVAAAYLFWTYWRAMRSTMYANR